MPNAKCKMQKVFKLLFTFCLLLFTLSSAFAKDTVLNAGISIDKVPQELYGNWRVKSQLISTNSEGLFKENCVDLWNLSKVGNVLTLDNPFSGAHASIVINEVDGRLIKFQKIGDYDEKKLTDTVQLNLGKETFTGINNLKFDTVSEGHVTKTEWATYKLSGEKISGTSVK